MRGKFLNTKSGDVVQRTEIGPFVAYKVVWIGTVLSNLGLSHSWAVSERFSPFISPLHRSRCLAKTAD